MAGESCWLNPCTLAPPPSPPKSTESEREGNHQGRHVPPPMRISRFSKNISRTLHPRSLQISNRESRNCWLTGEVPGTQPAVVGVSPALRRPSPAESATTLDQNGQIRTRANNQPRRLLVPREAEMHQQSCSDQLKSRGRVCCLGNSSFRDLGREPPSLGRDAI